MAATLAPNTKLLCRHCWQVAGNVVQSKKYFYWQRGNLRLRGAALIAVLAGAVGSVGFLLRAGQRTPRLLLVLMALWVLSPFVVLAWANMASKRWSTVTRTALHSVMLILTLGSLAIYGHDALRPRKAQAAFVFVAVPPASWLLIAIIVPIAALISGRRSRRADGA